MSDHERAVSDSAGEAAMDERSRPQLSPDDLTLLAFDVHDVPPDGSAYGAPLPEVVAQEWPWRSWLEAAVRSGYLPHQESVELAQRGLFLFNRARVNQCLEEGATAEASGWLGFADVYRAFAAALLSEADALDRWRHELDDGAS